MASDTKPDLKLPDLKLPDLKLKDILQVALDAEARTSIPASKFSFWEEDDAFFWENHDRSKITTLNVYADKPDDAREVARVLQKFLGNDFNLEYEQGMDRKWPIWKFHFNREETMQVLAGCTNRDVREKVQSYNNAIAAREAYQRDPSYTESGYLFAAAAGADITKDAYLEPDQLREAFKRPDIMLPERLPECKMLATLRKNPALLDTVIERLHELGVHRMALLENGAFSIAFATPPDLQGRQQVVVFSPPDEKCSPHPAVLPAVHEETILDDLRTNTGVTLRFMPEVELNNIPDKVYYDMTRTLEESQASIMDANIGLMDVRVGNIGIYRYTDEHGDEEKIPMLLDWGIGHATGKDKQECAAIEKSWKTMESLEPWRQARAHIASLPIHSMFAQKDIDEKAAHEKQHKAPHGAVTRLMSACYRHDFDRIVSDVVNDTLHDEGEGPNFSERLRARQKQCENETPAPRKR